MNYESENPNMMTDLKQKYKKSLNGIEMSLGETRIVSIPTQVRDAEMELLRTAVTFQPELYAQIYIAFLLGDNIVLSALETNEAFGEGSAKTDGTTRSQSDTLPSLYEKMLRTATTDPERFREIEYLLNTVDDDGVIPDGFKELYNTFKKVVKF